MSQLTLIAAVEDLAAGARKLPDGYEMRPPSRDDIPAVGRLYFAAYDRGEACDTEEEAVADISAAFEGEYGELWLEASPVIDHRGGIVAAIQVVRRAPWPDVPDCSFIIELFSDRSHRKRGLATALVRQAAERAMDRGETALALRVMANNTAARALYSELGFAAL